MSLGKYLNLVTRALVVILPLSIWACQKAASIDPGIEDEEYRVMTAVLKDIRFHRLSLNSDSLAVPHFSDTTDRPTYTRVPILRKPIEFWHANDTSRARVLLNVLQNVFGDATYYLAVGPETLDSTRVHRWSAGDGILELEPPEMLEDLDVKSRKSHVLSRSRFSDSLIVALVNPKEFGGWEQFYAAIPLADGVVWLSRVGFSEDRTHAMIFYRRAVDYILGGGRGRFVFLEKEDGDWRVIESDGKDNR